MSDEDKSFKDQSQGDLTVFSVVEKLTTLPPSKRSEVLEGMGLDNELVKQVEKMISKLDDTRSLFRTPITSRIHEENAWDANSWIGKQLKNVRLDKVVYQGRMTAVFKGLQLKPFERSVIVKTVRPDVDSKMAELIRFEQDCFARLSHPNIPAIYTSALTEEGLPFIVMEFIEGITLLEYCDSKRLPIRNRLELFSRVCDAVGYCHLAGILHRDIKPSNILVKEVNGRAIPYVIDFGIAARVDKTEMDSLSIQAGTPVYMSPEHFEDLGSMDTRSDIYSLGIVLFELLVGKIPFLLNENSITPSTSYQDISEHLKLTVPGEFHKTLTQDKLSLIAEQRAVSVSKLGASLDKELDAIFRKCIEQNKDDRYRSIERLTSELSCYLNNEPVDSYSTAKSYRLTKLFAKNKIITGLAATLVFAALSAIGILVVKNAQIKSSYDLVLSEKKKVEAVSEMYTNLFNLDSINIEPQKIDQKSNSAVGYFLDRGLNELETQPDLEDSVARTLKSEIARTYRNLGDHEKALEVLSLLDTLTKEDKTFERLEYLKSKYSVLFELQKNAEALDVMNEAISLANDLSVKPLGLIALKTERERANLVFEPVKTYSNLMDLLVQYDDLNSPETEESLNIQFSLLLSILTSAHYVNNSEHAPSDREFKLLLNRTRNIAERVNPDGQGKRNYLDMLKQEAISLHRQKNYTESVLLFKKIYEQCLEWFGSYSIHTINFGMNYAISLPPSRDESLFPEGLKFNEVMGTVKTLHDTVYSLKERSPSVELKINLMLAQYLSINNYSEAMNYIAMTNELMIDPIKKEKLSPYEIAIGNYYTAEIYSFLPENYEKALVRLNEAIELSKTNQIIPFIVADIHGIKALIQFDQGFVEEALDSSKEAMAVLDKFGFGNQTTEYLRNLAIHRYIEHKNRPSQESLSELKNVWQSINSAEITDRFRSNQLNKEMLSLVERALKRERGLRECVSLLFYCDFL